MRKVMCLVILLQFFLLSLPGGSYCYAADSKVELNWDYLTPHSKHKRDIDTVSLHILEKISESKTRSIYRGITITRPEGEVKLHGKWQDSSAVGIGPVFLVRDEKFQSGKLTGAIDMSGGLILYDKVFPTGGRYYDFMWRIGPNFVYKFSEDSSLNLGYMLMHVSNGFHTHNPGYDAHGVTLGFVTKF